GRLQCAHIACFCTLSVDGDGDSGGCGVAVQVAGGADTVRAGGDGGAVLGEQAGDVPGGDADGGVIDAEQAGDGLAGHAEPVAVDGGEQAGGQAELDRGGRALGPGTAGPAAGQVQALLAGGGVGDLQAGGQVAELGTGDAGDGGVGEGVQVRAGRGRGRLRLRGGQDRVVPFAARVLPVQDALFEVVHPLVADLRPFGVLVPVEDGGDLQALVGGGRGDAGHGVLGRHKGAGAPGAGDVAEQPVLDLVPLRRAGREVAHVDLQARLLGEDGELVFPEPARIAVRAAGVAGDQQPL